MEPSGWSIILLFLMIIAVILELLTPSMGGFTVVAVAAAGGSVWMGFRSSETLGYLMIAANILAFPITFWLGLRFLKHSPLMLNNELTGGNQSSPDAAPLTHLMGQEGRALTPLRPAGSAMIGDKKVDVVAQGRFIDPNTAIRVIQVEGSRVVVEPLELK
ncbi:MAG TPA: NfeD family protein [Planctomycetota bacterium]|nr:NfeD family protein [Planctomycetota bacterium]